MNNLDHIIRGVASDTEVSAQLEELIVSLAQLDASLDMAIAPVVTPEFVGSAVDSVRAAYRKLIE